MSRSASLLLSLAAGCLTCSANLVAHADTAPQIPSYFFKEWKVAKDCLEAHAGIAGHVAPGQKFSMKSATESADGSSFQMTSLDAQNQVLGGEWSNVKLEFRAGTKMSTVPADFECIPGETSSSPFLALSNYASNAEPWYEYEHWYALVSIHGAPHHLLIFPRNITGTDSAIIVLQDAGTAGSLTLDTNGVVHTNN
jgi:hypothetical protein